MTGISAPRKTNASVVYVQDWTQLYALCLASVRKTPYVTQPRGHVRLCLSQMARHATIQWPVPRMTFVPMELVLVQPTPVVHLLVAELVPRLFVMVREGAASLLTPANVSSTEPAATQTRQIPKTIARSAIPAVAKPNGLIAMGLHAQTMIHAHSTICALMGTVLAPPMSVITRG